MSSYDYWRSSTCAGTILAVLAAGCSSPEPQEDLNGPSVSEVGVAGRRLAAVGDVNLWSGPINVCFSRFVTDNPDLRAAEPTVEQYNFLKTLAVSALHETWQLVPGISFLDAGDCGSYQPTYLNLEIKWGPLGGGGCGFGVGTGCSFSGGLANQDEIDYFKYVLVHEVGHALGADHEHQRPDVTTCTSDLAGACQRCKTEVDAIRPCASADWNACTSPSPLVTTPQSFSIDSPEYASIVHILWNYGPWPMDILTQYDPRSIMNYCAGANGRVWTDYHPTRLDLLGMEILYPTNVDYPIGCETGCFQSGTGVITRTDGAITTDWTARGALNVSIISPFNGQLATSIDTVDLPSGASMLGFVFVAPKTGTRLTSSGSVVNSDSYHAAIVASIL